MRLGEQVINNKKWKFLYITVNDCINIYSSIKNGATGIVDMLSNNLTTQANNLKNQGLSIANSVTNQATTLVNSGVDQAKATLTNTINVGIAKLQEIMKPINSVIDVKATYDKVMSVYETVKPVVEVAFSTSGLPTNPGFFTNISTVLADSAKKIVMQIIHKTWEELKQVILNYEIPIPYGSEDIMDDINEAQDEIKELVVERKTAILPTLDAAPSSLFSLDEIFKYYGTVLYVKNWGKNGTYYAGAKKDAPTTDENFKGIYILKETDGDFEPDWNNLPHVYDYGYWNASGAVYGAYYDESYEDKKLRVFFGSNTNGTDVPCLVRLEKELSYTPPTDKEKVEESDKFQTVDNFQDINNINDIKVYTLDSDIPMTNSEELESNVDHIVLYTEDGIWWSKGKLYKNGENYIYLFSQAKNEDQSSSNLTGDFNSAGYITWESEESL